jgi:ABC-2 type transport system permease protein
VNLLKSEFLKLVYQRRTYGVLLAAIGISVLSTAFTPYALSRIEAMGMPLGDAAVVDSVYSKALAGYMFALILGVLIMSSEFQNHTAIATFLATPKRFEVLISKIGIAAIAGAIVNVIATSVGLASGAIALSLFKHVATPHSYIWADYLASAALTGAVLAVMGVSIGTLIRNQNLAVSVAMIWIFVVDRILAVIWTEVGKYLPTGLITAMMNLHIDVKVKAIGFNINTGDYLDPWPAAGLLLLYGVLFAVVSVATSLRRDID